MTPDQVDAFSRVGAFGFAIIAVVAFFREWVLPGARVKREREEEAARRDRREAELVTERNEWRSMAETSIAKMGRLTDVLEAKVGENLE
jgi:hypothetical protein